MDPCYKDGKGHAEGAGWTGFESWKVKDINAPLGLELCRITLIEADLYFNKKYTYFWRGINSLSPSPASPCYHSSQGSCFFSLRWGSAFLKDGRGFFYGELKARRCSCSHLPLQRLSVPSARAQHPPPLSQKPFSTSSPSFTAIDMAENSNLKSINLWKQSLLFIIARPSNYSGYFRIRQTRQDFPLLYFTGVPRGANLCSICPAIISKIN